MPVVRRGGVWTESHVRRDSAWTAEGEPRGAVVDPTAEIKTLTLRYKYAPSYWGMDGDDDEVDLQMGIPHRGSLK